MDIIVSMIDFPVEITPFQIIVPVFSSGIIMGGIILFIFIYKQRKTTVDLSILILLSIGIVFTASDSVKVVISSLFQNLEIGRQANRIQQVSITYFLYAIPLFLTNLLKLTPALKKINMIIAYIGLVLAIIITAAAFILPDLFISVTHPDELWLYYQDAYSNGQIGMMCIIRDLVLFILIIYGIFLLVLEIVLHKESRNMLSVLIGIVLSMAGGIYDLYYSYSDINLPPFADLRFSRFSFFIIIFIFILIIKFTKEYTDNADKVSKLTKKLIHLDRLKDDFLANTSHELRTPLNGIIGITESLIDGATGDLPDITKTNLKRVVACGKRLTYLVNDILDLSSLKNDELKLYRIPIDIKPLIQLMITLSLPLINDKKDLELKEDIKDSLPFVYADEDRLLQIFHNIIGNAIKFTEKGSITVTAYVDDGLMYITVSDTGIGIPGDKFDIIFHYFEQVDSAKEGEYKGTGLGLAITKKLIELHGGTIRVSSKVGKGSQFTFSIPLSTEKQVKKMDVSGDRKNEHHQISLFTEEKIKENVKKQENKKYNILIVDDEVINLQVLENHLTVAGFSVIKAKGGKEAIEKAGNFDVPVDLVLLDVMMPGISGIDVCKEIRKYFAINELPIILVTSKNQISDLLLSLDVGANDYITKPYIKDELFARMRNLLELREKTTTIIKTRVVSLHALAELTELKDTDTGNHIKRVAEYTKSIAKELSRFSEKNLNNYITKKYIEDIAESSILHDIGKVGIPDEILLKKGKLTDDEFEIMKNHSRIGGDTLNKAEKESGIHFFELGKEVAYSHHEKYNGTGYPKGLKGENIPLSARIVALADVYDALTSDRPYRKALSHHKAYAIILDEMGEAHFDPLILKVFKNLAPKFENISQQYVDT
ncbi:MAG: response regulator [Spirochaetales bacterium]|nr:response regulator [Spirochaetales bacterium]